MSVIFTSDLHIGDANTARFRGYDTVEDHDAAIRKEWLHRVSKRDKIFVLGDVGSNKKLASLDFYRDLPGYKHLVMGNHDQCAIQEYQKVFDKISGFLKYENFWLSHAPIHPSELRCRANIHGHLHDGRVVTQHNSETADPRYFNVNWDMSLGFVDFEHIVTARNYHQEILGKHYLGVD